MLVSISLFYAKGKSANLLTCLPQASNVLSNSLSEFGGQVFRADSPLFEGVSVAHRHGAILDGLTIDGDAITGLLISETDEAITLRTSEGIDKTVDRETVEVFEKKTKSMMPQDLQRLLTVDQLVNIVEYTMSLTKK